MKNYQFLKSIGILGAVALAVIVIQGVSAAGTYTPINPPLGNPATFLDISSTAQAKSGSLGLGSLIAGYNPTATVDVTGSGVVDVIGSLGAGWVTSHFKVGGSTAPTITGSELAVEGSRIRSTILAGTGERSICADSQGRLKICQTIPNPGNPPVPGTPPADPILIFLPTGNNTSGVHEELRWSPVMLSGSSVLATTYELQSFDPAKNFDTNGNFSSNLAAANNWVTYGAIDYSTGPNGSNIEQVYDNWVNGDGSYYASAEDFVQEQSPGVFYTVNNQHNDNNCLANSTGGCAYRIRAVNGSATSNWSNVIVLYDPIAPTSLSCGVFNAATRNANPYTLGNQTNLLCSQPTAGVTNNNSMKLTWGLSQLDNQNSPFIKYSIKTVCAQTQGGGPLTATLVPQNATSPYLINSNVIQDTLDANPSCSASYLDPNDVFHRSYRVYPERDYPASSSGAVIQFQ